MIQKDYKIARAKALILGIAFKENCPDIRNTKVVDIYNELRQFGMDVDIYDPWADREEVFKEYGIKLLPHLGNLDYQAVVVAVAHKEFLKIDYLRLRNNQAVIFDTKGFLDRNLVDARL
jgi:UDP-N-acetyl-D-galactosamine dehydrogenase